MTTYLDDLFDTEDLAQAVDAGHVRTQVHPTLPYVIYNYTELAAYSRVWTPVTRQCRGLIAHAETEEVLARPLEKFFNHSEPDAPVIEAGDPVVVTDKLDGCFPRGTALNLWGGGTITIERVVQERLPVTLVGMDETGRLVPATVTDWHNNGRKERWLDIEVNCRVSRQSGAGGHPNRLRVTVNHHIALNGEYRPACEIQPGDVLTTQSWAPDENVLRLVRASLLGDGCVTPSQTNPSQAKYQESHSEKQEEYVAALRKALGDTVARRPDSVSGYGSRLVWVGSREYRALGDLRREWYPDGVKRVPADLSWMDDFAVAKWLMDDGCRQHFAKQADRISFSTHSFPEEDIRRLGDRLAEMYGISYHLVQDSGRGFTLVINSGRKQQIRTLWAAIAQHVHPSMRYKLPEEFRDAPWTEPTPGRELAVAVPTEVLSVTPVEPTKRNFPSGCTGFDITTTTHNYLARGVLVHNSLGILYPTGDGGHAIATRGSFASVQAQHATELWQRRYADCFIPVSNCTYLFEIVYPENRIVVDYGGMDDLVLLAVRDIPSGMSFMPDTIVWPGPKAQQFDYATFAEALAAPPRPGKEGLVVRRKHGEDRVKLKQEDYVYLHRIVTGMNERVVWEHLGAGKPLNELIEPLPDEFHDWVRAVAARLIEAAKHVKQRAVNLFHDIVEQLEREHGPEAWARKDFALQAIEHGKDLQPWLFHLLDGRDPHPAIWKTLRPSGAVTMCGYSEEAA
jgi:RNA ligase